MGFLYSSGIGCISKAHANIRQGSAQTSSGILGKAGISAHALAGLFLLCICFWEQAQTYSSHFQISKLFCSAGAGERNVCVLQSLAWLRH